MSENPDIFHRIVGGGEGGKIGEGNCAQNPALRGFVGYVLHSPSPLTETKFVRNSKLCVCVCVSGFCCKQVELCSTFRIQ
jgi:hypothetical protein